MVRAPVIIIFFGASSDCKGKFVLIDSIITGIRGYVLLLSWGVIGFVIYDFASNYLFMLLDQ